MMNIRDFIFINKAKSPNKIRILDILGFDTNADLTHSPEIVKDIDENLITSEIESDEILIDHQNNTEFYPLLETELEEETSIEQAPTNTFEPINITSQIKKIWTDIESRRQWVVPAVLITVTIFLIVSATGIFINNRNRQNEIINLYETLTKESNELINTLPELCPIPNSPILYPVLLINSFLSAVCFFKISACRAGLAVSASTCKFLIFLSKIPLYAFKLPFIYSILEKLFL